MSDTSVPTPPPGLSGANIAAVQAARAKVTGVRPYADIHTSDEILLADLLSAYDALAARMAWLAANMAEHDDRYDGLS